MAFRIFSPSCDMRVYLAGYKIEEPQLGSRGNEFQSFWYPRVRLAIRVAAVPLAIAQFILPMREQPDFVWGIARAEHF
jgi:hypothetical protein